MGDGNDIIDDSQGHNSLVLHNIEISQLKFFRESEDLKIVASNQQTIRWKNFYTTPNAFLKLTTTQGGNITSWRVVTTPLTKRTESAPYIAEVI